MSKRKTRAQLMHELEAASTTITELTARVAAAERATANARGEVAAAARRAGDALAALTNGNPQRAIRLLRDSLSA